MNAIDLLQLLGAWGPCGGCPEDINGNGEVEIFDLVLLVDCWGDCPCPDSGDQEHFDETVTVDVTDAAADAAGFVVTHVYATGANVSVGDTLLLAGLGEIDVQNGTFHQHIAGGNLPPDSSLFGVFPELEYDTFAAMKLLADDPNILGAPDLSMDTTTISGSWFAPPVTNQREAVDISGITGNPGQAGVLIAQLTLIPTPGPSSSLGYVGSLLLFTASANGGSLGGTSAAMAFSTGCPWDCDGSNDGFSNVLDLLQLLVEYDVDAPVDCVGGTEQCDYDGNGCVDVQDLLKLLIHYSLEPDGSSCP